MVVKEMLESKYREKMANITEREWKRVKADAECYGISVAECIIRELEITETDIKQNGGWYGELHTNLLDLHKQKLIASNKHRQERGHVDRYWLTPNGYKKLFA